MMGAKFTKAGSEATLSIKRLFGAFALFQGAQGLGRLTVAGTKWGLSFNSQVEQARLRFQLFTTDVDGLTKSVQAIDRASMFNFADLADAAALLGGSGIKDVPGTLQAAANAAAGGGKGTEGLKSIVLALSQIQSKGRLSQEEINQLTEGGAITAQRDLTKGLHLTAKELQNVGGQGIEAKQGARRAHPRVDVGQDGRRREAAAADAQRPVGPVHRHRAEGRRAAHRAARPRPRADVIPAANRAADQINEIFGKQGLSNEEKMRQARAVIKRELGPIGDDLKEKLDEAKIPEHLGELVGAALPKMAEAAADAAPHVAEAFVTAWMHSGPWAKLITALAVWKKIGAPGLPGGGGKGGLGGVLGSAKPVPVFVTNWGGEGGKGIASRAKDALKTAGPAALGAARSAVIPAAGDLAPALAPLAGLTLLATTQGDHNLPTRGRGASSPSNPAGSIPPPGFGTGPVGALTVKVVVNDREVATATAAGNAKQRARN
jgi:tape measure domain-containing protein